jgi:hypothetical protein
MSTLSRRVAASGSAHASEHSLELQPDKVLYGLSKAKGIKKLEAGLFEEDAVRGCRREKIVTKMSENTIN